jgi:hypothetical protein
VVWGSCWKASPKVLREAMVTDDVFPLMPANIANSGVSITYEARGVKTYQRLPKASDIITPMQAAIFSGSRIKSRHSCSR